MTFAKRFLGLAAVMGLSIMFSAAAVAGTLDKLPGRWTGYGEIRLSNGSSERVKCVATYFLRHNRQLLEHNLRCASPSFRIDAKAKLAVRNRSLSGAWRERTYATGGQVAGRVDGRGLHVEVTGDAFQASLSIRTGARCRQAITLRPTVGLEISELTISLSRNNC